MSRRQRPPRPAPHDYTPDIDLLHCRLAALALRWQGVAPTPPSLAEQLDGTIAVMYDGDPCLTLIRLRSAPTLPQRDRQNCNDGV